MKKVILYINQFFGGIGGEDQADFEPVIKDGPVGPGSAIQASLENAEIINTVVCGDNFMNSHKDEALSRISDFLKGKEFDLFLAGPAFQSGRYGMSCGEMCRFVGEQYGVPTVTCMNEENPGVDAYRDNPDIYIMKGNKSAAKMREDAGKLAAFGNKLMNGEEILWADAEGYFGHGIRKEVFVDKTSGDRAVDMMLNKLSGGACDTEYKIEIHDSVAPARAVSDITKANIAIISTGGLVAAGNPDRMPSGTASIWKRYAIDQLDAFLPGEFFSVHGGFSTNAVNADPEVQVPLSTIKEIGKEGGYGSLHPFFYATTGNLTTLKDARRMGGEIAQVLKDEHVDGVIFVST